MTMAISGRVVATLSSVRPTNFAPYFFERCSAPYASRKLATVSSESQKSIVKRFSAKLVLLVSAGLI
jgi:hypothetical protein